MPANTPNLSLPYPTSADTVDVPRDIKALADKIDPGLAMNIAAVAPVTPYTGQQYYDTVYRQVLIYDGTAWQPVSGPACIVGSRLSADIDMTAGGYVSFADTLTGVRGAGLTRIDGFNLRVERAGTVRWTGMLCVHSNSTSAAFFSTHFRILRGTPIDPFVVSDTCPASAGTGFTVLSFAVMFNVLALDVLQMLVDVAPVTVQASGPASSSIVELFPL